MISSGSISTRIFQTGFFSIRPLRSHRAFTRPPILNPTNIRLELVILMELIDCKKINYCSIHISTSEVTDLNDIFLLLLSPQDEPSLFIGNTLR